MLCRSQVFIFFSQFSVVLVRSPFLLHWHQEMLNQLHVGVVNTLSILVCNLQNHHPCLDEFCTIFLSQQGSKILLFHKSTQSSIRDVSRPCRTYPKSLFYVNSHSSVFRVHGLFSCHELLQSKLSLVRTRLSTPA